MPLGPASIDPPPWEPRSVHAGGWRITALCDGYFRLDGGSMWGVVPKALWQRMTPARENNTILLALRPFLAERGDLRVVIEPGIGNRWEAKWRHLYHIEPTTSLVETLAACGVEPDDVTHVVASHCHWDHVGGQVVEREGALEPLFPNARHFAPAVEVEMAKHTGHARDGSYRSEDVSVVEERGLLETYAGEVELLPGLRVHELGGHSDGVSVVTFGEGEEGDTAIFWSDVVPTAHHAQPPYIMAYDLDVVRSYEVRTAWMERAAAAGWIGLFYHDPDHAFGRLAKGGKRYELAPLAGEPRRAASAR